MMNRWMVSVACLGAIFAGSPCAGQARPVSKDAGGTGSPEKLEIPRVSRDQVICFALYTVSNNTLKLTAQLYPLDAGDDRTVRLEVKKGGQWDEIATTQGDRAGLDRAVPRGEVGHDEGRSNTACDMGRRRLRRPDSQRPDGQGDHRRGRLHRQLQQRPRPAPGHHPQHQGPGSRPAVLLRRPGLRPRPALRLLAAVRPAVRRDHPRLPHRHHSRRPRCRAGQPLGRWRLRRAATQAGDDGGYHWPAEYVQEVERAQTSHLPDPYDPTCSPIGIGVYYTPFNLGGISFAIIEDRKFKTGPRGLVPEQGPRPDHVTDPNYDRRSVDVPGAKLLGERQEGSSKPGARTGGAQDEGRPLADDLRRGAPARRLGGRLLADLDSNGWPQTGRNKASALMRKAFALHIAGDQHLGTVIHHGIDD